MKKCYKLTIDYDDEIEEVEELSEVLEELEADEGTWLDTGTITVKLPKEMADCLEKTGILGMA